MSELSKQARQKMKEKAQRLVRADPRTPVDASGYRPPDALDGDVMTGERPVSRRQFKCGGVAGAMRPDRMPRKSGGSTPITADSYLNRDVREANKERVGIKHVGGFKRGGHVDEAQDKKLIRSMMHKEGCKCAKCMGGRAERARGGASGEGYFSGAPKTASDQHIIKALQEHGMDHVYKNGVLHGVAKYSGNTPDEHVPIGNDVRKLRNFLGYKKGGAADGNWIAGAIKHPGSLHRALKVPEGEKIPVKKLEKAEHSKNPHLARKARLAETLKKLHKSDGGRMARKSGGKTGKTNVNIIISTGRPQQQPMTPPVGPLPGGPVGMRQGVPPSPVPPGAPSASPAGMPMMARKAGGRIHMTAGAGSGEGRLQKIKEYGDKA